MASLAFKIATNIAKTCGETLVAQDYDVTSDAYIQTKNPRRCLQTAIRNGFRLYEKNSVYKVSPDGKYAISLEVTDDCNTASLPGGYGNGAIYIKVEILKPIPFDRNSYTTPPNFLHAIISYAVLENTGRHAFYPEAKYIASVAKKWSTGGGAHEDIGKAFKQLQKFPYNSAAKQCFTDDGPSDALCRKLGVEQSELAGLAEEIFTWVGDNL